MRFRPKNMFIGELLYLYFRFSNIDIFDYDDTINDIFLAFYEIIKVVKQFKKIKVSKKSIDRFKFLKQVYTNFIYKN